jgi:hypothetical protein
MTDERATVAARPTATEYARAVAAGAGRFDWADFERSLLSRRADLLAPWESTLRDLHEPRRASAWRGAAVFALSILPLVVPGLLVIGIRTDQPLDGWLAAAIALSLAHIALRIVQLRAARRGAAPDAPQGLVLAGVSVAFAVLAAVLAALIAIQRPQPLAWPAFAAAVAMAAVLVIRVVAERRRGRAAAASEAAPGDAVGALRAAVERLAPGDRAAIQRDRDDALELLARSGLLSDDARRDAADAPLGGIARRAWAEERRASGAGG